LKVADFSLAASTTSLSVVEGNSVNFNVIIQGTAGWTDQVATQCTAFPQVPSAPVCNLGGTLSVGTYPVTVSAFSTPPGDFTIQLIGTAAGITHQAPPLTLRVQNATAGVSSTSASIAVGSSANFNVSVNSQNGLTDQFTYSCPSVPAGLSFNPPSGTLPANGTLTSVLTITVNSSPTGATTFTPRLNGALVRRTDELLPSFLVRPFLCPPGSCHIDRMAV
jgi:hypothetical protein